MIFPYFFQTDVNITIKLLKIIRNFEKINLKRVMKRGLYKLKCGIFAFVNFVNKSYQFKKKVLFMPMGS